MPPDGDLLLRLRRRQPGAFDEVYRRYQEPVWRFLCRLSGSKEAAEDDFQDTWLAAARHAHRLHEDTRLLPWLYTIARNKHRSALRSRMFDQQRARAARVQLGANPPSPEDQADTLSRAKRLTAAWARLPDAYREVLALFAEGLDTSEIARILERREDAVRKRLSRARAELLRLVELNDVGGGDP
jgi:RNA polymerase sigma factor (sigma-70 family)